MRILNVDAPGLVTATNLTTLLTQLGSYTINRPPLAYFVMLVESAQGASAARMGGPDVSATRGVPFAAAQDKIILPALLSAGGAPSRVWNLDITYLYIPSGDTVSIAVWVD